MLNLEQTKYPRSKFLWDVYETEEVVDFMMSHLRRTGGLTIGYDTETTGLDLAIDRPVTFQIYSHIPITCKHMGIRNEYVRFAAPIENIAPMKPLLESPDVVKTGSRISGYDYFMTLHMGIDMVDPIHDSVNMDWLRDENRTGRHGLKELVKDFFKIDMPKFKSVTGGLDVRTWPFDLMLEYSSLDPYMSERIHARLRERLMFMEFQNGESAWDFYVNVLVPYQRVLRNMTLRGVEVDVELLEALKIPIEEELTGIQTWFNSEWMRLQAQADMWYQPKSGTKKKKAWLLDNFQAGSVNQLRFMFFDLLKRNVIKKRVGEKSGEINPSLDKSVLTEYEESGCPYAEKLLAFRKLEKIATTYIEGKEGGGIIPKVRNGRLHPEVYLGTVTGRLASRNPNIQNIPARGKLAKVIRQAFKAKEGYKLIVADYKQLEMLLFAHFSGDPVMLKAVDDGKDFHCMTAAKMYGKTYEEMIVAKLKDDGEFDKLRDMGVTDFEVTEYEKVLLLLRFYTKSINFGILYGMGPGKLSQQLGITMNEARNRIKDYFHSFPSVRAFIDGTHRTAVEHGMVWTLRGRPRRISEAQSVVVENWVKARALRQSVNSIIQGSAADVVMLAMMRCEEDQVLKDLGARLLIQVHDELVFEVPEENYVPCLERIKHLMEYRKGQLNLLVDLPVSIHVGDNWSEAK